MNDSSAEVKELRERACMHVREVETDRRHIHREFEDGKEITCIS